MATGLGFKSSSWNIWLTNGVASRLNLKIGCVPKFKVNLACHINWQIRHDSTSANGICVCHFRRRLHSNTGSRKLVYNELAFPWEIHGTFVRKWCGRLSDTELAEAYQIIRIETQTGWSIPVMPTQWDDMLAQPCYHALCRGKALFKIAGRSHSSFCGVDCDKVCWARDWKDRAVDGHRNS